MIKNSILRASLIFATSVIHTICFGSLVFIYGFVIVIVVVVLHQDRTEHVAHTLTRVN